MGPPPSNKKWRVPNRSIIMYHLLHRYYYKWIIVSIFYHNLSSIIYFIKSFIYIESVKHLGRTSYIQLQSAHIMTIFFDKKNRKRSIHIVYYLKNT